MAVGNSDQARTFAGSPGWEHPSVVALAGERDPVQVVSEMARDLVFGAIEKGWVGPPFDPFALAELLRIDVRPLQEVSDARLKAEAGRLVIEYNPTRPRNRIRYSIAHEIGHSLFPDAAERMRWRRKTGQREPDQWQLETLCDIAAAEILMPAAYGLDLENAPMRIDVLSALRDEYQVSMEALLLRVVRLTKQSCAVFAASRQDVEPRSVVPTFRVDYASASRNWPWTKQLGGLHRVTSETLGRCSAVGFTSKGEELWWRGGKLRIECIGVPPVPGTRFPRVLGLVSDGATVDDGARLEYLVGDATEQPGHRMAIVAHIVNDKTPNWGGRGFARALADRWPRAQDDFREWARGDPDNLRLGQSLLTELTPTFHAFHMVAQKGYGESKTPRIRYRALEKCLLTLADHALARGADVQMPRIGTGLAGGNWAVIETMVREQLTSLGVNVAVYSVPGQLHIQHSRASGRGQQLRFTTD